MYQFDGVDYTFDWGILCHSYISKFFDFLRLKEANNCAATIGIKAAHYSFEYHTVTRDDIQGIKLSQHFEHTNCLLFLKLCSFITEISSYPSFLAASTDTFWCDTEVQNDKAKIKARSLIIADTDKIIIAFLADGDQVDSKCKEIQ